MEKEAIKRTSLYKYIYFTFGLLIIKTNLVNTINYFKQIFSINFNKH